MDKYNDGERWRKYIKFYKNSRTKIEERNISQEKLCSILYIVVLQQLSGTGTF